MGKLILNFIKRLVPFTIILFLAQNYLPKQFLPEVDFFYSAISVNLFLFVSTLIVYMFVVYVNKNFSEKTGFAFLAGGMIKMFASIVFLIPLLKADLPTYINDVLYFFIPYFMFLLFETFLSVKLLHKE